MTPTKAANLSMLVQAFDTSFAPLLANEQELSMARNGIVQTKRLDAGHHPSLQRGVLGDRRQRT